MKKNWMVILVFSLALAPAVPGFSKGTGGSSHGSKSGKHSKGRHSHKSHHKSVPQVERIEKPMDDGPPAGWH